MAAVLALSGCPSKVPDGAEAVADQNPEVARLEGLGEAPAAPPADLRRQAHELRVDEHEPYELRVDEHGPNEWWRGFGEPCTTTADCAGCFFCVPTQLGSICTCGPCACCEECGELPAPWGTYSSCFMDGGDSVCACLPDHGCIACRPCASDAECAGGSGLGLCLDLPGGQRACAEGCWGGKLCLPWMECKLLTSSEGKEAQVCISPATGMPVVPDRLCLPTCCEGLPGGTPCDNGTGLPYTACQKGECVSVCTPDCAGRECGGDGCGGECGGCDDGDICTDDSCTPAGHCLFLASGACDGDCPGPNPQGCLASGCPFGEECTASPGECLPSACTCDSALGVWACTPDCSGGVCACLPDCAGRSCGDDGCTGSCGECPDGLSCDALSGQCLDVPDGMVLVPGGEFWMGCNSLVDSDCAVDEYPAHKVSVGAFFVDRTEATVDGYGKCVDAKGCTAPATWPLKCNWAKTSKVLHPVNCIDWEQADGYCTWSGGRLCAEAEWEKAARGTTGGKFPWGNEAATCDYAVMSGLGTPGCGSWESWPVGSKPAGASPCGAWDMAGNVLEWTADWYGESYYSDSPTLAPEGPDGGSWRVVRGGSFLDQAEALRASRREPVAPTSKTTDIGVRCCRSPE